MLKWLARFYKFALLIPFLYIAYLIWSNHLGANPAKSLNHRMGSMALYMLLGNLLIGALIAFRIRWPRWLLFLPGERRFLGVVSFLYLVCHVFFYFLMECFEYKSLTQLVTKSYLIFGELAWLIIATLAITSNNYFVRRLGAKRWKKLHRLIYAANLFFTLHIVLLEKPDFKFIAMLAFIWLIQSVRFARWAAART